MLISDFFTSTLGAELRNKRWSWGATDGTTNRVFLRVWADEIETHDGIEYVLVSWHEYQHGYSSLGIAERRRHIDQIENGAEGFGVVCEPIDLLRGRKIAEFDSNYLIRFGEIVEFEDSLMAEIAERVPVGDLTSVLSSQTTILTDLKKIFRQKGATTEKEARAKARVGQGQFRTDVLRIWGNRCAVTGCSLNDAIRASHIKPWSESSDEERLDPNNGLPLIATIDALFDNGLITFKGDGEIVVSDRIGKSDRKLLALECLSLSQAISKTTREYLKYHREEIFR